MKGLFYPIPCIEFIFGQAPAKEQTMINLIIEKPYNQVDIYIAWFIWSKRFKFKFR